LSVICEQMWAGNTKSINEQSLGVLVFGRREGYSVGDDSIVRSQARFLRQRLAEHFIREGTDEDVILCIPKGSYLPVFSYRVLSSIERGPTTLQDSASPQSWGNIAESAVSERLPIDPIDAVEQNKRSLKGLVLWLVLTAVLMILAALSIGWLHRHKNGEKAAEDQFWASIFALDRPRIIVVGDISLVLIEGVTNAPVHLSAYLNKTFLEQPMPPNIASVWPLLKHAEYTRTPDLNLATLLEERAYAQSTTAQIRFANDISLQSLKESNVILIGAARANPWVELFDAPNRFLIDYDPQIHTSYVLNRPPHTGEDERYIERDDIAYGVVAYLPSVDGKGSALLLEGVNKPGTDAAGEFLFSTGFSEFLHGIAKEGTVPYFEILLSAQNTNGGSHHVKIICHKIFP